MKILKQNFIEGCQKLETLLSELKRIRILPPVSSTTYNSETGDVFETFKGYSAGKSG